MITWKSQTCFDCRVAVSSLFALDLHPQELRKGQIFILVSSSGWQRWCFTGNASLPGLSGRTAAQKTRSSPGTCSSSDGFHSHPSRRRGSRHTASGCLLGRNLHRLCSAGRSRERRQCHTGAERRRAGAHPTCCPDSGLCQLPQTKVQETLLQPLGQSWLYCLAAGQHKLVAGFWHLYAQKHVPCMVTLVTGKASGHPPQPGGPGTIVGRSAVIPTCLHLQ